MGTLSLELSTTGASVTVIDVASGGGSLIEDLQVVNIITSAEGPDIDQSTQLLNQNFVLGLEVVYCHISF